MQLGRPYYSLVIKSSNLSHAVGQTSARRLYGLRAAQVNGNEVRVDVRDDGPETLHTLQTWFNRHGEALPGIGYAKGTLLLFSPHVEDSYVPSI
jgi:hypothetical protein